MMTALYLPALYLPALYLPALYLVGLVPGQRTLVSDPEVRYLYYGEHGNLHFVLRRVFRVPGTSHDSSPRLTGQVHKRVRSYPSI